MLDSHVIPLLGFHGEADKQYGDGNVSEYTNVIIKILNRKHQMCLILSWPVEFRACMDNTRTLKLKHGIQMSSILSLITPTILLLE